MIIQQFLHNNVYRYIFCNSIFRNYAIQAHFSFPAHSYTNIVYHCYIFGKCSNKIHSRLNWHWLACYCAMAWVRLSGCVIFSFFLICFFLSKYLFLYTKRKKVNKTNWITNGSKYIRTSYKYIYCHFDPYVFVRMQRRGNAIIYRL